MRVAVAQMDCEPGDVGANCSRVVYYAEKAKRGGADLVVFPELVDTGYDMVSLRQGASGFDGLPYRTVADAAAQLKIAIVCGLSEREGGRIFNSAVLVADDGGAEGKYRKVHLFTPEPVREDLVASPGDALVVARLGAARLGVMICYDLRFPEMSRALADRGADVLVVLAAWPRPRGEVFRTLCLARAIENQVFLVAANRVGSAGPLDFCGTSLVAGPRGELLAAASDNQEELLFADLDLDEVVRAREELPAFRGRRKDLYNAWMAAAR